MAAAFKTVLCFLIFSFMLVAPSMAAASRRQSKDGKRAADSDDEVSGTKRGADMNDEMDDEPSACRRCTTPDSCRTVPSCSAGANENSCRRCVGEENDSDCSPVKKCAASRRKNAANNETSRRNSKKNNNENNADAERRRSG